MLHAPVMKEFQRSQLFWAKFLIHSKFIDIIILNVKDYFVD